LAPASADPVIVKLNLLNARQVGNAFEDLEALHNTDDPQAVTYRLVQPMRKFHHQREVFVAVRRDSVFGPVIAFEPAAYDGHPATWPLHCRR
jgi:acyl-CoA synthetase (NDP forming)